MEYYSGDVIQIGDKIKLWDGNVGVVVCSVEDGIYSDEFTKEDWEYLKYGVLVRSETAGLIHLTVANADTELLERRFQVP